MSKTSLKEFYKGKNILITGGTGSIGSEICRELLKFEPKQIRIYSRDDTKQFHLEQELRNYTNLRYLIGDVRDRARLFRATEGIDLIFHIAALKHVEICEYNPFEAIKTNVVGTDNVIDAAIANKVQHFLLISTDKATNPTNTMGVTKLLAERLTVAANLHKGSADTLFSVVRFGNVFGSRGSVVELFVKQIIEDKKITITNPEMTRYFMTIKEATQFVLSSMMQTIGGEIFIKRMSSIRIGDLAKGLIDAVSEKYNLNKEEIKTEIIGIKPGERIHELLLTSEESSNCYEMEDKYVIVPAKYLAKTDFSPYFKYSKIEEQEITSDKDLKLSVDKIKNITKEYLKTRR
jgi:FlaA1/EpsC-like NDP-sugar epimerase